MKPFELMQSPLGGVQLIEAGAGTGKTYNIAALFLRLIVERGLGIHEILVVTYTKAATEELKSRIRHRLVSAKTYLIYGGFDNSVEAIVESCGDRDIALQRIVDALTDFDRAAIFTIHGFCQRLLNHFAFETGYLFDARLVQDDQPVVLEMAEDFWRRYISPAPAELIVFALNHLKGPEELAALFFQCRAPQADILPPAIEPPLTAIQDWRSAARQVAQAWPTAREAVLGLLASEGLNAKYYGKCAPDQKPSVKTTRRQAVLTLLASQIDGWDGRYPCFDFLERLTPSFLAKATKKKFITPQHSFFELCGHALSCQVEMETQMVSYLRYLKVRLLNEARERLDEKKRRQNMLFFDDLLIQVHRALQSQSAPGLVQAIRGQYRAALVDEFQDTDALQYEIFTRLFSDENALLFMIGDPKQAIYSFRGADLFSYLRAKAEAPHQYTLAKNWRATPQLVRAINALFVDHPAPFGYPQIGYTPAVAARPDAASSMVPFHLWYLTRGETQETIRPIAQEAATDLIVTAVAEEIVALLSRKEIQIPFEPQQIAVLTRTHRQAQKVKSALSERRVPAVLHSAGSVFETREADALGFLLEAVAAPSDPFRVRAALACELIGVPAKELCASVEAPTPEWEARWARFGDYHHVWQQEGFYPMFTRMLTGEGIKERLLCHSDGERRLTNLLHLAELLHQASSINSLRPETLLAWFERQRRDGGQGEDVQKLRLESDAKAVRIITIHKSKGLQFDVVFCPFVWAGARIDDKSIAFHDPDADHRLTYAIGPDIDPSHSELALQETLAENIRLLYVAVTRAKKKCYLAWGCIRGTEISAPAYLFHGQFDGELTGKSIGALKRKMAAMTDAQLISELALLEKLAEGTICVQALPQSTGACHNATHDTVELIDPRRFRSLLDTQWRIASFSSLTAGAAVHEVDAADRDADEVTTPAGQGEALRAPSIFSFPKGAKAGLFFHDLLEHWDFTNLDDAEQRALAVAKLANHEFDIEWGDAVVGTMSRLGQVKLGADGQGTSFCLSEVPWGQRINEMEFHFPLKQIDAKTLGRIFGHHGLSLTPHQWTRIHFSPIHGFMKGYVDMIFAHDGRYYLVDWKSNHLGNSLDDYRPQRLSNAMAEAFYYLQYHLYVVALDQWLRRRVSGYRYEAHFGGVYYIFLRGIGAPDADTGIYYDLPSEGRVEALREALLEESR